MRSDDEALGWRESLRRRLGAENHCVTLDDHGSGTWKRAPVRSPASKSKDAWLVHISILLIGASMRHSVPQAEGQ